MSEVNSRFKIAKSFGSASASYDISARLQRYCGKHLMPWLPNRNDLTALDLGAGTGFFTDLLASRYQQVLGLDISKNMLRFAKENRNEAITWLEADAYKIPLQDNSIDFVYSNLMIQWCDPLDLVLDEVMRVLKPGGLFVFSTLVDGTLFELKSAWAQVDDDQHVIDFKPEQDIRPLFDGNDRKLLNSKQQDIVLEYDSVLHLAHELKSLGANHVPKKQGKGLAGKDKWQKMTKSYQDFLEPSGIYPATYKVFSGLIVKLNH
ncbi:malonyl-[acyl-carrier protein] O-methyltransferase BioC [Colwellia sp. Arc7-635]|uniref:malonyl-ACP O-methyltransferase BioC n=1 Tax=Colwellia sp. Arc7-635 TaxID=2497879 RepID=UPI000F8519F2|nr:malonyl-ACP O-methyltransferase BioC [Colwellia sp. Arc7-635]AZQ84431.1 malonyl-[acyl-carrier protein] O-methyltransferase BioC [Colwellia sp. Arc7-635]